MILFSLPRHEGLARALEALTGLRRGRCRVERFTNLELHATIDTAVAGEECLLLGATAPPDEDLLATLLIAHTLAKEGARSVTALIPYLGYARHDKADRGRSLGAAWIGGLLDASRVDAVVTVDVHSPLVSHLFPIPVRSLSPAELFAAEIAALGAHDATVVAPDEGALERSEAVRVAAGVAHPVAHFVKRRTDEGVVHVSLRGAVGRRAIVVDDILDTGGTLVSACAALQQAGVEDITVMVTHGVFTGTRWQELWSRGVRRIYCTDTCALAPALASLPITVRSVAPLLATHFAALVR